MTKIQLGLGSLCCVDGELIILPHELDFETGRVVLGCWSIRVDAGNRLLSVVDVSSTYVAMCVDPATARTDFKDVGKGFRVETKVHREIHTL